MSFLSSVKTVEVPDSELLDDWAEGSGSTVGDSEGSNDGTISGSTWVTGSNYFDGAGLDFATNDYVEASSVVDYLDHDGSWTIALSVTPDTTTNSNIFTATTSDSGDSAIIAKTDAGVNTFVYEGSSITDEAGDAPFSTGSQISVIVSNNAGSLTIYWPSGSSSSASSNLGGAISSTAHTRLGANPKPSGLDDGVVDILQIDNSVWGSAKRQQFFDAMP